MSDVSLFLLLAAAAWSDWRMRKVPNSLTFPFMTAGLLYQFWQGTAVSALAGILLAFVLTLFPAMLRGLGMGDQKLLMAAGAWTNPEQVYLLFLYALCSCLLTAICVPSRWPRLRTNMVLFAAGWYGHRQLWFPERTASALSFPFAVHLLVVFTAERIGR